MRRDLVWGAGLLVASILFAVTNDNNGAPAHLHFTAAALAGLGSVAPLVRWCES